MPEPADLLLFYDALCPICTRSVEALERRGLLARARALPLDEAPSRGVAPADCDGLRSEMLLYSTETREAFKGFDALLKLLEAHRKAAILLPVLKTRPARWLGGLLYRAMSLNRRILSPPANSGVACACDPPFDFRYRALLCIALEGLIFSAACLLRLAAVSPATEETPALSLKAVSVEAAAQLLALAPFLAIKPPRLRAAFWQTLASLSAGAARFVPFAFVSMALLAASHWAWAAAFSWLGAGWSLHTALASARRRFQAVGLPCWSAAVWMAFYLISALSFGAFVFPF
jgi:predicted DCC family thiol-disulfide oxidoreductase YuxK